MTLQLDHVTKAYATGTAVDDVSFSVPRGVTFGLLGPNGAGKTTTIRMVLDIIRPDRGSVTWEGTPAAAVPRTELGYLPEERGLYLDMPVAEQVAFFAEVSGLSRADAKASTQRWLARLDIEEHAEKPVSALSKGNQQKVQLLVTIVHEPALLVLDEPFSGLDPVNHALLEEVLAELKAAGTTLVLSTHDMEQVESLCDEVAMLHRGQLVFAGSVGDLRARHADQRRQRLCFHGDTPALRRELPDLELIDTAEEWDTLERPHHADADELLRRAMAHGQVRTVEDHQPSMREIFFAEIGE